MVQVIGLGAGGHARVVIDILQSDGEYEVIGLLDANPALWQTEVLGVPVLGDDDLLLELYDRGVRHVFIGVGTVGDTGPRQRLYEEARGRGLEIVPAIHPHACVSQSAQVGCGPTIMAGAVINAGARIGDNVIVNTGAIVEHDCTIGDHVHIATGAHLAGAVCVGEGVHIGLSASVLQGVRIARNAIVGAGAVVVRDVPEGTTVVGVPARILQEKGGG
jgi:UDP-perosamine 4-acetyltransferase